MSELNSTERYNRMYNKDNDGDYLVLGLIITGLLMFLVLLVVVSNEDSSGNNYIDEDSYEEELGDKIDRVQDSLKKDKDEKFNNKFN
jgi:hypothetical protein